MAVLQQKTGSGRTLQYFQVVSSSVKHLSEEEKAKNPGRGYAGFSYQEGRGGPHLIARALTGNIATVRLTEDEYEGNKYPVASIRLVDGDDIDEIVKFRLDQSLGRSLIGLIAASELNHGGPTVDIYISQSFKGDKWANGSIAEKDATYISMKPAGAKNEDKFKPVFVGAQGQILSFKNDRGEDSALPMAKKVKVNGKEVYDFGEQTDLAMNNARALEAHFKDKADHAHSAAPATDNEGIDLNEAAAAAAPRG